MKKGPDLTVLNSVKSGPFVDLEKIFGVRFDVMKDKAGIQNILH